MFRNIGLRSFPHGVGVKVQYEKHLNFLYTVGKKSKGNSHFKYIMKCLDYYYVKIIVCVCVCKGQGLPL